MTGVGYPTSVILLIEVNMDSGVGTAYAGDLHIGDRIKGFYEYVNYTGIINSVYLNNNETASVIRDDYHTDWTIQRNQNGTWGGNVTRGHIELISTSTFGGCMDIKGNFILSLVKEPNKSFRKAGITDNNDLLTDDGQKIFMSWLLHKKYADEFKTSVVDEMTKDTKTEAK
jgi:hypothetical protein